MIDVSDGLAQDLGHILKSVQGWSTTHPGKITC